MGHYYYYHFINSRQQQQQQQQNRRRTGDGQQELNFSLKGRICMEIKLMGAIHPDQDLG